MSEGGTATALPDGEAGQESAGLLRGLRIGLVGPAPPPSGGMAHQTEQLRGLLVDEGAEVTWVVTNAPYRPAWVRHLRGIRAVFRLVPHAVRLFGASRRADLLHVMANSGWSWFLFAVPAVVVGRLTRTPLVVNYRGGQAEVFLRRLGWLARPTMRLASAMVVPSGFLERVFAEQGISTRTVPNIVDLERFRYRTPSNKVPYTPRIAAIRNLEAIYGNDTALRAFARVRERHPRAHLTIAGVGPERERLAALTEELGIADAVDFCGRLDRAETARLLEESDAMVNASRVDNMPNAILEALATGTPVVTTSAGGIPIIVTNERTALLCPVDDHVALADQLCRVLSDRDVARRLAEAGRAEVERYAWPQVREQWAECYAAVTRGRTGR